jgi:hypothetical protein
MKIVDPTINAADESAKSLMPGASFGMQNEPGADAEARIRTPSATV